VAADGPDARRVTTDTLLIGIETWEELKSSENIDEGSVEDYGRRRQREKSLLTRAFKQCCADGQVGVNVLKQIRADYNPLRYCYNLI
jgi:hypothetical protein